MLPYTITKGGTYSTDAYEYRYTTSITVSFTVNTGGTYGEPPDPCNPPLSSLAFTSYAGSTEKLFHNGRRLESIFVSYKDNNPTSFSRVVLSDDTYECIGGYYSTNSYTLRGYSIYESNGKATEYSENISLTDTPPFGTYAVGTLLLWTRESNGTTTAPVTTTRTVDIGLYNTTNKNISFKSSFIKVGDSLSLINFETVQKTNTNAIVGKTTVISTSSTTETTRLGYSYKGTNFVPGGNIFSPSQNFNYADTVVLITNNNILWYITDYGEGEFTKKFKSTRGIGQQVTIKHNTPTKKEMPIGFLPYGETTQPVKSTISNETTALSVISFKEQNMKLNEDFVRVFPWPTYNSETNVLINSTSKFTTKSYKKYEKTQPIEEVTDYKTLLQLINGNTLQFHRTYKAIDTILTSKSFITYSYGEYTISDDEGGTTLKDKIGYTSLGKECYSLNTDGGGEFIFNKRYLNGQAAINNLSIVEQVLFKDGQTYININGGNLSFSLYQNVPLAFASFAKSFTFNLDNNTKTATAYSPIEDTNLKLDLRYVLISSSKESTSSNKAKYTKIETTKHEFSLKGVTPTTYLTSAVNNLNKGLLVNPNEYCNLKSTTFGFDNMNCGIFCNDGQLKSSITRIIYPGTYLAINIDGSKTSVIAQPITTNQNNKFYYYLPWNGSIQSNGTTNLLKPSMTSSSHNISNFLPEIDTITRYFGI